MGKYQKLVVKLKGSEQKELEQLLSSGVQPVRVTKRALVLRLLAEGQSAPTAGRSVGLTDKAVREIGWRHCSGGMHRALYDRPRPGAQPKLTTTVVPRIVAMVCEPAPQGHARWTVRLIAEEAVKRKLVNSIGREAIRVMLQRHKFKPWREKNVVCGRDRRNLSGTDGRRAGRLRAAAGAGRTGGLFG